MHIDFEYPRGIKNRSIESAYEFNSTPGNIVLTQSLAISALYGSIPMVIRISAVNQRRIDTGIKITVITKMDLCKYNPQSFKFYRPAALETNVSNAVLIPIITEYGTIIIIIFPRPIPARSTLEFS